MTTGPRFSTQFGPRLAAPPSPLFIPRDPDLAAAFALRADHAADEALADGRFALAERLSHAALEARARAETVRA